MTRATAGLVVGALMGAATTVAAVPPFEVPTGDSAPRVDADRGVLVAASVGAPDGRVSRLSAIRLLSRRRGEERAREALHRFADDALARLRATPWDAAAVHRAIDDAATVDGVRALADGGAVVQVAVPLSRLRAAATVRGAPWAG